MKKVLSIYRNCSFGGMGTVLRSRAVAHPAEKHWFLFEQNWGGLEEFNKLANATTRIISGGQLQLYIHYITKNISFDEVRITSNPILIGYFPSNVKIIYEFHTSNDVILAREIYQMAWNRVDEVWVPSNWMFTKIKELIPLGHEKKIIVQKNIIDASIFNEIRKESCLFDFEGSIPLIWIGRFDLGKNVSDFIKTLSLLPDEYIGVVVSLDSDLLRMTEVLSEALAFGLWSRLRIFLNLRPWQLSELNRQAAMHNGIYCSTSLGESFGYTVAEASYCGLPTVAYDVGALREHNTDLIRFVDVGDLFGFAEEVLSVRSGE